MCLYRQCLDFSHHLCATVDGQTFDLRMAHCPLVVHFEYFTCIRGRDLLIE